MKPGRARAVPAALPSGARRRLLVVEQGASLTCRDDAADFDETTAITELAGEGAEELATRVMTRVGLAEHSGQIFGSALLVVSEAGSSAARRLIAKRLAAHGAVNRRIEELVLLAPAQASPALRESLLQLTDELLFGAEPSPPIRLCFAVDRQAEQRSGTFWSIPERDPEDADTN